MSKPLHGSGTFLIVVLSLAAQAAFGQRISFVAEVSAKKIGIQDRLQITYTISDVANLESLNPGGFSGFQLVDGPFQQQSSSATIVGNARVQTTSCSLTYILKPLNTGHFTFPVAIAKDKKGHSYQSNTVSVEVVPGSLAPRKDPRTRPMPVGSWGSADPFAQDPALAAWQQRMNAGSGGTQPQPQQSPAPEPPPASVKIGRDLFLRAEVDNPRPYVGQQVTASYKLYTRLAMDMSITKMPVASGFWAEEYNIPQTPQPTQEVVNGQRYNVYLLKKTALFPQQAGTLVLEPATGDGTVHLAGSAPPQNDPFGPDPALAAMMGDPFGAGGDVPVHLSSLPVTLAVQPLPAALQPQGFGGAVGRFTVSARLDRNTIKANEAANLILTISGSGNLKLVQAPALRLPAGLEAYEPQVSDSLSPRGAALGGAKIITYPVTAQTAGTFSIPPVTFSWFDAGEGVYHTSSTLAAVLTVTPGAEPLAAAAGRQQAGGSAAHSAMVAYYKRPLFWSLVGAPVLALLGFAAFRKRKDGVQDSSVAPATGPSAQQVAGRVALQRMEGAQAFMQAGQPRNFYEETARASWLYLADKLRIPLSALSRTAAMAGLQAQQATPETIQKTTSLLDECELALYTPAGGAAQMQATYQNALAVIDALERQLPA